MNKFDAVLFDLDGTLTDSKPGILRCIKLALDEKGISCPPEIMDKMIGPPFRVSMKEFLGIEDTALVEELIRIYRAEYEAEGWRECSVYDGIEDMLKRLTANGLRLGVATSKPIKFTDIMMIGLDLAKYFEFIGGASSDISRDTKSNVINYVLYNMGITDKNRVIMVGDRKYDTVGAAESGIDCVGVLWGYGDREELEEYGACHVVSNTDELVSYLTQSV